MGTEKHQFDGAREERFRRECARDAADVYEISFRDALLHLHEIDQQMFARGLYPAEAQK